MQHILSAVIDTIAAVALVYFATGLALSLSEKFVMPRPKVCPGQLAIDFTAVAEVELPKLPAAPVVAQVATPDPWELPLEPQIIAPTAVEQLFPPLPYLLLLPAASVAVEPDWKAMTPTELRKACQERAIVWRNAHGKNRHLKKSEMLQQLSA